MTPIDFGKEYLENYYRWRKIEESAEFFAEDVIFVTPSRAYHFRSRSETRAFLEEQAAEEPENYQVDIVSIKRAQTSGNITEVIYELNLIPRELSDSVFLRCSMTIQRSGLESFDIAAIHMSRPYQQSDSQRFLSMTDSLSFGMLVVAALEDGLRTLFYNKFISEKMAVGEADFEEKIRSNPFFMLQEQDQKQLRDQLARAGRDKLKFRTELTIQGTGKNASYGLECIPVNQEENGTVFYCLFQEVTEYRKALDAAEASARQERLGFRSRIHELESTVQAMDREKEFYQKTAAAREQELLDKLKDRAAREAEKEEQLIRLSQELEIEKEQRKEDRKELQKKLKLSEEQIRLRRMENEHLEEQRRVERSKEQDALEELRIRNEQDRLLRAGTIQRMKLGVLGIVGNSPDLQAMLEDVAGIGESAAASSLKNEAFQFDSCMATVRRLTKGKCRLRGLAFQYRKKGIFPEKLIGDKHKLQLALLDLLEYLAEKTCSGGTLTLTCQCDAPVRDKVYCHFLLEDTMDEIREGELEELLSIRSSELAAGAGFLRLMGGGIQIRNRQGAGSELEVTANLRIGAD